LSSEASIVLLMGGLPAGAAGICKRWLQAGQFRFVPAWSAGDSSGFLQLGQLYLIGGAGGGGAASSLASIVLSRAGVFAAGSGFAAAGTRCRCVQLGQFFFVP